jgi:hypothetical protein|tara:strand:- start:3138 stop:3539 length:402 start_codon:yes stop_codon:yes gene_type:complete
MAHFAKIGSGNIVEKVEVVSNDIATTEQAGVDFLNNIYKTNDLWKQTSYNTIGGVHRLGGTPFRKNYAGQGYVYDETKDAFIAPKPYNSWILNETSCRWESPTERPELSEEQKNNRFYYKWNESNLSWELKQY